MAPLEKHVRIGNIAKKIVAECETTEQFAKDPKVADIYAKNPSDVPDNADKQDSTLAKPETIALPSDKHTPKAVTDVDVKTSYTDLTNYVPAKIKRAEKSEIPTVTFDFDEKLLHAETEKELEDYFDGAHLVKLKEIMQKEFIAPKGAVSGMMDDKPSKYMFSKDQMPHKGEAANPINKMLDKPIKLGSMKSPIHKGEAADPANPGREEDHPRISAQDARLGGMSRDAKPCWNCGTLTQGVWAGHPLCNDPDCKWELRHHYDVAKAKGETLEEKKAKLGSGARFKKVKRAAAASGARNPAAVAAKAGREKYGQKKMTALAQKGKRDAKK